MVDRLGTPTLGELADAEQVQPPTMTRLVDSLEQAGMVVRTVDDSDKRVCRVKLSEEGGRAVDRVRSLKNAFLTRQIAGLDPADSSILDQLVALVERLAEER
jgi:DNA-binding MarR family transcriptional regulator